jgi:hypothetical protein
VVTALDSVRRVDGSIIPGDRAEYGRRMLALAAIATAISEIEARGETPDAAAIREETTRLDRGGFVHPDSMRVLAERFLMAGDNVNSAALSMTYSWMLARSMSQGRG